MYFLSKFFLLIIGNSVLFYRNVERFLLNNTLSIERILKRLELRMEAAYNRYEMFVHLSFEAFEEVTAAISELLKSRENNPRWPLKRMAPQIFVSNFCAVLKAFDAKDTNLYVYFLNYLVNLLA